MDYKYIKQLLERYWQGETSLEEEQILRAFFSQTVVPVELRQYQCLFVYEQTETKHDTLGDDFDQRLLSMIGDEPTVKARRVKASQHLWPLFKAAAVVAIFLTLSNAAQMSFREGGYENVTSFQRPSVERSVALTDSAKTDTMRQAMPIMGETQVPTLYK